MQDKHDRRLIATLERLQKCHITLNRDKCIFSSNTVHFLGHVIDEQGIKPDPIKMLAIQQMKEPESVSDSRRFLGMCNQFSKFALDLVETTKPLRDLLGSKNQWIWDQAQRKAFTDVKFKLSSTSVLCLYDYTKPTKVSANASSFAWVAETKRWTLVTSYVAYCSRSSANTEQKIEKEALSVMWTCERFTNYLLGMNFEIETDHKPLVPLLGGKLTDELPL